MKIKIEKVAVFGAGEMGHGIAENVRLQVMRFGWGSDR
jgi:3-hydroxyacyl-CoA dehydrogenase